MTNKNNIYSDLFEIAGGNLDLASDRLKQFTTYANSVAGIPDDFPVEPADGERHAVATPAPLDPGSNYAITNQSKE